MTTTIHPVILSGGTGTRLWPLSRANLPKQFLAPFDGPTLLQATARRVSGNGFAAPLLVCHKDHRFIATEQLRTIGIAPAKTFLEPVGRNTAPAVAIPALEIASTDPTALMLVLPADHAIGDEEAFRAAVEVGIGAASLGMLVTFGVRPKHAETGYGYIHRGKPCDGAPGCFHVETFIEKPRLADAEAFLKDGHYLWNSGIFLFSAAAFLEELNRFEPAMLSRCEQSLKGAENDLWFHRLPAEAFSTVESKSIDYAVMEHTKRAAVVEADFSWSDLGTWAGLWQAADKDDAGNAKYGEVATIDVRNSCLYGDGVLVAALGVNDLVIAARDDAVVVAPRNRAQDIRQLVDALKTNGDEKHLNHPMVFRPWGHYQTVIVGDGFLVKRIEVNPGGKLSVQLHHHRAEHWIIVSGSARIARGDETFDLQENESTYIPGEMKHSIENLNETPLTFIEVQTGDLLSEDDIVRFEDVYGRSDRH